MLYDAGLYDHDDEEDEVEVGIYVEYAIRII